ncbi:hypothetical protein BaRGS_00013791, partial [Batillaria attramentaria]
AGTEGPTYRIRICSLKKESWLVVSSRRVVRYTRPQTRTTGDNSGLKPHSRSIAVSLTHHAFGCSADAGTVLYWITHLVC